MRMLGKARTLARPLALLGVLSRNQVGDLGVLGGLIWALGDRIHGRASQLATFASGFHFAYVCFPFERGSGSRIFKELVQRQ